MMMKHVVWWKQTQRSWLKTSTKLKQLGRKSRTGCKTSHSESILQLEEKHALSHNLCGFLWLTSKKPYVSFPPLFYEEARGQTRMEAGQGNWGRLRLCTGTVLMHICCLKGLLGLLNKYQMACRKMISCVRQNYFILSWLTGHLRGLVDTTSFIYFWMLFNMDSFVRRAAVWKPRLCEQGQIFLFVFVVQKGLLPKFSIIS